MYILSGWDKKKKLIKSGWEIAMQEFRRFYFAVHNV